MSVFLKSNFWNCVFLAALLGLFQVTTLWGQDRQGQTVTGKVVDNTNRQALPGATITVKGTANSVVSGNDGTYKIDVPADAVLAVTYTGYDQQEVAVGGRSVITVSLTSAAQQLEDVVVIGYGTVKKQNLTGAVSSLKGSAFQKDAITSAEEGIAGKIPGVRVSQSSAIPGGAANIKIRGMNSITASSSPLYVIDGIPQEHMRNVNPRDIASIEVLKDAASAAIYGARGGNGVIVVTTKSGSEGATKVDFESYAGFQEVDKTLPMMNRDEYIDYTMYVKNERYRRTGGDLTLPVTSRPLDYQYPVDFLDPQSLPDNNWQDLIFRQAMMQNYNLNVSGGGKIGTFVVSGGYLNQAGVMEHTGFERYNLRINTNFNVSDKFKVGANLATSITRQNAPETEGKESNLHYAIGMPPMVGIDQNTESTGYSPVKNYVNPLIRLAETKSERKNNNLHLNTYGEYKPIPELTLRSQIGYNFNNGTFNYFKPFDVSGGAQATGRATNANSYNFSIQNTATYQANLGQKHDLNVLLGQSFERNRDENMDESGAGYPNDFVPTLNQATTNFSVNSSFAANSIASFFGRVQYNYLDRYLLSVGARYDGSSKFGSGNRWGLFPSVSAGWKINEEPFMKTVDWISLLKIRGSLGKAGNDRIGNYEAISLLTSQNYTLNGKLVNGLKPNNVPNGYLGWETTVSKDAGLDVNFFQDRIQLSADVYFNRTKDLLLNVPVTRISGYSTIRQNLGEVENNGWELALTTVNLQKEGLRWTTSFNFSQNTNKVLQMGPGNTPIITQSWGSDAFTTRVGYPIGSFYTYKTDGVLTAADFGADGQPLVPTLAGQEEGNLKVVDVNKDGKITTADETELGSYQPKFLWGVSSNFSYKGFDFSFDIQGQQGGKILYIGRRGYDNGLGEGTNQYERWLHSYKKEESKASIPAGADMSWDGKTPSISGVNPTFNDTWLYDATFVRIRNITLGYTLPSSLLKKWGLGATRIYIMGDNVHTFTDYPGMNPEANNEGGSESVAAGQDYGAYPLSRRFTIGLNIGF